MRLHLPRTRARSFLGLPVGGLAVAALASCSLVVSIDDECTTNADCDGIDFCADGAPCVCQQSLCVVPELGDPCENDDGCPVGQGCQNGFCIQFPQQIVQADITQNETWTDDRIYVLDGLVRVRGTDGDPTILTIQPGVRVIGGDQSAALIFENTARLVAVGTDEEPIVFTSPKPVGERATGDWGGVALTGKAVINTKTGTAALEGVDEPEVIYGGNDPSHNCGNLQYVRIEFAGFVLATNEEINGLTLAGCGSATVIDFVQVHLGRDDGIELFGGSANIRHAVVTDPGDDGLDWDQGWNGFGQFIIVRQADLDKNGIEADNNEDDNEALPRSAPIIYNMTVLGTDDPRQVRVGGDGENDASIGATLRRGTAGTLGNIIFSNQGRHRVVVDGEVSQLCALRGAGEQAPCSQSSPVRSSTVTSLRFDTVVFHTWRPQPRDFYPPSETDVAPGFGHENWMNSFEFAEISGRQIIEDPFAPTPDFRLSETLPEVTPATPFADEFFDGNNPFVGALRPDADDDWTVGWTHYPLN